MVSDLSSATFSSRAAIAEAGGAEPCGEVESVGASTFWRWATSMPRARASSIDS